MTAEEYLARFSVLREQKEKTTAECMELSNDKNALNVKLEAAITELNDLRAIVNVSKEDAQTMTELGAKFFERDRSLPPRGRGSGSSLNRKVEGTKRVGGGGRVKRSQLGDRQSRPSDNMSDKQIAISES